MQPPRSSLLPRSRERLRQDFSRAAPLREIYPHLAEVHIEFEFADGTPRTPSPQAYAYYPAARGFFRYACPCHDCSGEFDLSAEVAELAGKSGRTRRTRRVTVLCGGQRLDQTRVTIPCPIQAQVHVSATLHATEQLA